MKHQTFERFQGMWWGGIVGQAVANQNQRRDQTGIINFPPQNWLVERRQIAEILFQSPRPAEIKLSNCSDNLLSLLSLIIFYGDNQDLLLGTIDLDNLKFATLAETTATRKDILIWSYLLDSVWNHEFESSQINFNLLVEKILTNLKYLEGIETVLTQKLKLVAHAVNHGTSLHDLSDKMSSNGNIRQTAIALSWYCFVTTPHDFRMSVKRAASIKSNLAEWTTPLTGILSGAYNGITGIPHNWRINISQNQNYASENQTVIKLFKAWLGIYSINSNQELYNQELDAVASTQMIQPRKTLKIISQKTKLNRDNL